MNLAVLSESAADEAAIRVLAQGILGVQTQTIPGPPLRSRGWPSVREVLQIVISHLHYKTDAFGLVVVVDSDGPVVHRPATPPPCSLECRLCELRATSVRAQRRLRPVAGRHRLHFAAGLAVPAIEAWYRTGVDPRVSEATWLQGYQSVPPKPPYTKSSLKRDVYGTDRPSQALQAKHAAAEAHRLLRHLDDLVVQFPGGFGSLVSDLRAWPVKSE